MLAKGKSVTEIRRKYLSQINVSTYRARILENGMRRSRADHVRDKNIYRVKDSAHDEPAQGEANDDARNSGTS